MSKNKSQTVSTEQMADPYVRQQAMDIYNRTNALAKQPYQAYGGQTVAGLTPDFQTGAGMLRDAAATGGQAIGDARAAVQGMIGRPAGSFLSGDISKYMNPYQTQAIDATLGDLNRSRIMAQQGDAARASAAGAFGGDRHGIVDAETNRNYADIAARTAAQMRDQGFNTAAQLEQSDLDREMQARGYTLAGANAIAGLNNADYRNAGQLLGLGQQYQGQNQAELNDAYNRFAEKRAYPWQMLSAEQAALAGVPQNTTNTQTQTTHGSFLGGLLGAAGTLGSMFLPGGPMAGKLSGLLGGGGGGFDVGPQEFMPDYATLHPYDFGGLR